MTDYSLPAEKLAELRAAHRDTRDKREADRIKAVLALATGWTAEEVAEILQVDANTVRNHQQFPSAGPPGMVGQAERRCEGKGRRSPTRLRGRCRITGDDFPQTLTSSTDDHGVLS